MPQEITKLTPPNAYTMIHAVECKVCNKLVGLNTCYPQGRVQELAWFDPHQSAYVCRAHLSVRRETEVREGLEKLRLAP